MHPTPDPLLLASGAALVAAIAAVLGRWRDLSSLSLCLAGAAALEAPAWAALPAAVAAGLGAVRGLSRGVARPELTWLALALVAIAHGAAAATPAGRSSIAVGLAASGVLLGALATVRRTSVRAHTPVTTRIPVAGAPRGTATGGPESSAAP